MHTDRRRFRSESLMRSSLCTHSCRIRLRTSRIRSWAEIIGTLGRLRRTGGDVCGGPNMSDSSSPARPALPGFVGRVIICCFAPRPSEMCGPAKFANQQKTKTLRAITVCSSHNSLYFMTFRVSSSCSLSMLCFFSAARTK
uniref:(northern house mosquito) hypothetical protein n=1 Tax=Culex pipiens TaxID=7175 RepID=A0A8D8JL32_CULPI